MRAGHGGDGGSSRSTGHDGEDKIIEVPLGTVVKDQETGEVQPVRRTKRLCMQVPLAGWSAHSAAD